MDSYEAMGIIEGKETRMKSTVCILSVLLIVAACSRQGDEVRVSSLESRMDSVSYSIGINLGAGLKSQDIEINSQILKQGFMDGYLDREPVLAEPEYRRVLMTFQQDLRREQQATTSREAEVNKAAGEIFLKENATRKGVVTLPSGLQYRIITKGDGPSPSATDNVVVHYTGKLLDGTVFDSSVERGSPATFRLNQVIKGWTEGLQLMHVGSKYELFIPSHLAYGPRGSGGKVKPNQSLIFKVELLEIK
jgi:FKBP-type peptidyl-prolyl cis-trans isomerase FklB